MAPKWYREDEKKKRKKNINKNSPWVLLPSLKLDSAKERIIKEVAWIMI